MQDENVLRLYSVWQHEMKASKQTQLQNDFENVFGSIFTAGPSYYYVIDFYDMSLSHVSPSIEKIHGVSPTDVKFTDIISFVHPDDIEYVRETEAYIIDIVRKGEISFEEMLVYKGCYNFRMRTADGSYKLFQHQGLQLTLDENNGIAKALNIHTDISHITSLNNYKFSLIHIHGGPCFTDIDVYQKTKRLQFTKREKEIIRLISKGLTSKEIANELKISFDTVKNHRRNILEKSGVQSSAELITHSMVNGLL